MSEYIFQIGDRVVSKKSDLGAIASGDTGTVCAVAAPRRPGQTYFVGVCWDKYSERLHDCDGKCDVGHGWVVLSDTLDILQAAEDLLVEEIDFEGFRAIICDM